MSRIARTLVVLVTLTLGTVGLGGTVHAATASNGKRCTIVGTNRAETLRGTASNDVICGLGGDDKIYGLGGNDFIDGGAGWDWMWGGSGTDVLYGGADTDTVFYDDHKNPLKLTINGKPESGQGGERDTITLTVENIDGGPGNDVLLGSAGHNVLGGEGGNDTIDGGGSGDALYGGTGFDTVTYANRTHPVTASMNDRADDGEAYEADDVRLDVERLLGGKSNDRLFGSQYSDVLIGNEGNDLLQGRGGPDYLFGGAGTDTADYSDHAANINVTLDGYVNDGASGEKDGLETDVENVTGGRGNDTLRGNNGPNTLSGGAGNDTLVGYGGGDIINGDAGNDRANGGDGDDRLRGGAGNDYLDGATGIDVIQGGVGTDTLLGGDGNDRIGVDDGGPDAIDGGAGTNICGYPQPGAATAVSCTVRFTNIEDARGFFPVMTGHLLGSDGMPVVGARAYVYGGVSGGTTDSSGTWGDWSQTGSLHGLVMTTTTYLPGRTVQVTSDAVNGSKTDREVTFTLPAKRTFTVHVVDTDGTPIKSADVIATDGSTAAPATLSDGLPDAPVTVQSSYTEGYTGEDGTVSFTTLSPVLTYLSVFAPGEFVINQALSNVTIVDGGEATLVVDLRPSHVTGTITSTSGPLSGVKVTAVTGYAHTDTTAADGSFALTTQRYKAPLTLEIPSQGSVPADVKLTSYSPVVDGTQLAPPSVSVSVPAMRDLTVHVVDENGTAVEGAEVALSGGGTLAVPDLGTWGLTYTDKPVTTGAGGAVVVPVYDGNVGVVVTKSGPTLGKRTGRAFALLSSTSDELTVVINLQSAVLSGNVTDGNGAGLDGVKVSFSSAVPPDNGTAEDATTTVAGSWSMHSPQLDDVVVFEGAALPGYPRAFTVTRAMTAPGSFDLSIPVRHVVVTVTDQAGVPRQGATVSLNGGSVTLANPSGTVYGSQSPLPYEGVVTGVDGTISIPVLPGTFYGLVASIPSKYQYASPFTVTASDASITIKL